MARVCNKRKKTRKRNKCVKNHKKTQKGGNKDKPTRITGRKRRSTRISTRRFSEEKPLKHVKSRRSGVSAKSAKKGTTTRKKEFDYDKIMCDDVNESTQANRFFKMKCYKYKGLRGRMDMEERFHEMVQELIDDYRLTTRRNKYNAFVRYIRKNYNSFSPFSKEVTKYIFTRFQEDAVPTMDFIF